MHRLSTTLSLLALMTASATAQTIALTPEQVGEAFCLSRLGNDAGPIAGLLTLGLAAAIAEAEVRNEEWAKANPGEKPPLGDGIPWAAWPDYARECTVGAVTFMMDEASVQIAYGFPDASEANFTDSLSLRLVDDSRLSARIWRIDNVAYATDGDLRNALLTAFLAN